MAAEFVPFLPALRAKTGATGPSSDSVFSPVQTSTPAPKPCPPAADLKVELKRDGDRITQIRIQCHCGETIELDCEY